MEKKLLTDTPKFKIEEPPGVEVPIGQILKNQYKNLLDITANWHKFDLFQTVLF